MSELCARPAVPLPGRRSRCLVVIGSPRAMLSRSSPPPNLLWSISLSKRWPQIKKSCGGHPDPPCSASLCSRPRPSFFLAHPPPAVSLSTFALLLLSLCLYASASRARSPSPPRSCPPSPALTVSLNFSPPMSQPVPLRRSPCLGGAGGPWQRAWECAERARS
jgi:hypothetical protein